ncbi:MAG: shikimate kinase [Deltaproteobacteria bacterium]|nr:MAG: shikimate kinase [Deltaproteobacteria bacterium]
MNLYLVGYRCTGKTSVGRLLSDAMGWTFVDMDNELVAEAGIPIEDIVNSRGWKYFREREAQLLEKLSQATKQVISTGGGIVTVPENVATMRGSGKVIWLHASPATIAERMEADIDTARQRPPLHGNDSLAEIEEVFAERLPLYDEAMHLQVETDGLSQREVAEHILRWLETKLPADR